MSATRVIRRPRAAQARPEVSFTPGARPELVHERAARILESLPQAVRELLERCDGSRTLEALENACRLPLAQVRDVLALMRRHGLVVLHPSADFSEEEERFFGSPIDHLVAQG